MDLPSERDLRDLTERFRQAEARIRSLVSRAVNGNRAELLSAALLILHELRRDAAAAGVHVENAYAITALAVSNLTGKPTTAPERANDLGRSLAHKLYTSTLKVETATRDAMGRATAATIEFVETDAVITRRDRLGRRVTLGTDASMLSSTIGRSAVSRATADVLGRSSLVEIVGGKCPICQPLQGVHAAGLEPPFHPHCKCAAVPIGYSLSAFEEAMNG